MSNQSNMTTRDKKHKMKKSTKRTIWLAIGAVVLSYVIFLVLFLVDRMTPMNITRVTYSQTYSYDQAYTYDDLTGDDMTSSTDMTYYDYDVKYDTTDRATLKKVQELLRRSGIEQSDTVCLNEERRVANYDVKITYSDGNVQDMSCKMDKDITSSKRNKLYSLRYNLENILSESEE